MDWWKIIGAGIIAVSALAFVANGIAWAIAQGVEAGMQDTVDELKKTNEKLTQIEKVLDRQSD